MPKKPKTARSAKRCPALLGKFFEIVVDYFSNPLISTLGMFGLGILFSEEDLPSYENLQKLLPLPVWGWIAIAVSLLATAVRVSNSRVAWQRSLVLLWACYSILVVMFALVGSWTGALVYGGLGVGVIFQRLELFQPNKWVQKVVVIKPECPPSNPTE
jgi:hypothetical protein